MIWAAELPSRRDRGTAGNDPLRPVPFDAALVRKYDVAGPRYTSYPRGLVLTAEDLLRRDIIMRLMCHSLLPKREIEAAHGIDFDSHFAAELAALRPFGDDGLVELGAAELAVTPAGRLLVRNLAMVFDSYLAAPSEPSEPSAHSAPAAVRYSRTV